MCRYEAIYKKVLTYSGKCDKICMWMGYVQDIASTIQLHIYPQEPFVISACTADCDWLFSLKEVKSSETYI